MKPARKGKEGKMRYTLNSGKTITIPDKEIEKMMKKLELSVNEAVETWLSDNGYEINEEQEILDEKAKKVRAVPYASSEKERKKSEKPRTVKVSDEKQLLFSEISTFLTEKYGEKVEIVKENKLIKIKMSENKTFKVDLIEERPKKA